MRNIYEIYALVRDPLDAGRIIAYHTLNLGIALVTQRLASAGRFRICAAGTQQQQRRADSPTTIRAQAQTRTLGAGSGCVGEINREIAAFVFDSWGGGRKPAPNLLTAIQFTRHAEGSGEIPLRLLLT